MGKLNEVIYFIVKNYPHEFELSKARLTKMVYLADWQSALVNEEQITEIEWEFNHYGPYVEDVISAAREDRNLRVEVTLNMYGREKEIVSFVEGFEPSYFILTDEEMDIIQSVIETTQSMFWNDFIVHVYDTFPIRTEDRYTTLDLVAKAREFEAA